MHILQLFTKNVLCPFHNSSNGQFIQFLSSPHSCLYKPSAACLNCGYLCGYHALSLIPQVLQGSRYVKFSDT